MAGYWKNKAELAATAKQHVVEMEQKHSEMIRESIALTKIYSDDSTFFGKQHCDMYIDILNQTTTQAISLYSGSQYGKVAALNFASYKNPGGAFLEGSSAQEEALCHDSTLYNVLKEFKSSYYDVNFRDKNRALYTNKALYTPGVIFNDKYVCDVITCAAPNKYAAQKYCNVLDTENNEVMEDRIAFLLDIAENEEVDTLILGAWGCGVFGQNPNVVASLFVRQLKKHHCFKNVVFAIPADKNDNYDVFNAVIKRGLWEWDDCI